jgi:23S rRNA pseudouridine2605 synthase
VKERIQKVLANAGVASRRSVEEMVLQGRVAVNGRVVTELPVLIDPDSDRVSVDDEPVKLRGKQGGGGQRYYLLMNKPRGVYSTNVAQGEQVRAIDLLPPDFPTRVYPVGRLDAESTGLLLLTNDGDLTNQLTHPRFGVPKTYRAIVDGTVSDDDLRELEKGVWLADERTGQGFKATARHIRVTKRIREKGRGEKTILEVTLREGRNRQVRRMLAKIGHKVRDLSRIKIGPLTLHGLPPGKFRPLTPREVRELREYAGRKPAKGPQRGGRTDGRQQHAADEE